MSTASKQVGRWEGLLLLPSFSEEPWNRAMYRYIGTEGSVIKQLAGVPLVGSLAVEHVVQVDE